MSPQRIVAPNKGAITLESFDLPAPGPGQVLVETHYSAISPGTELAFLHHKPNTTGVYPFYPGYSACGSVIEVGEAVEGIEVDDLVACHSRHASHSLVEAARCVPLPGAINRADACTYRLVSIVIQGILKAQIRLGGSVAVVGLGPIGNLAGQLARASGATHVEGIDPVDWRRDLALACGFDAVASSAEQAHRPDGYDVAIDATGVPAAIPVAFGLAKYLGQVLLLASTRGETEQVNFYRDVHKKGLTIIGAHDSIRPAQDDHLYYRTQRSDDSTALKLIASHRIQVTPLVSDIVAPTDAAQAYARLMARNEQLMLIAFKWK